MSQVPRRRHGGLQQTIQPGRAAQVSRRRPGDRLGREANIARSSRFAEPEPVSPKVSLPGAWPTTDPSSSRLQKGGAAPKSSSSGGPPPSSSKYDKYDSRDHQSSSRYDSKYDSKPPPPVPRDSGRDPRDLRDSRDPRDSRDARDPRDARDSRDPRDRDPRDRDSDRRRYSPTGPTAGFTSPPPSAHGPRPSAGGRAPASSRPPPSPAADASGGADPTLLPLFRAVDKDGTWRPHCFPPSPSVPPRRASLPAAAASAATVTAAD